MKIKEYLTKRDEANTVLLLVGIAVAVLVLAVIFTVGPLVGYQVDTAVTIPTTGAGAGWNSVTNPGITNGSELWTQNTPMLYLASSIIFTKYMKAVAALIAIVGVINLKRDITVVLQSRIAVLMGVAGQHQ